MRSLLGLQIGQNQRYRLSIFILDKVKDLSRLRFASKVKRSYLQSSCESADHIHRSRRSESFIQDVLGISDTALGDILLGKTNLVKLRHDRIPLCAIHLANVSNLKRQAAQFPLRRRCLNIWADTSGPSVISRMAAF